jgi:hypothetical protein
MLPPYKIEEIERLPAQGKLSRPKIARRVKVSLSTVKRIAKGQRRIQPVPPDEDLEPLEPTGPPVRCPGCGRLVFLPCKACETEAIRGRHRRPGVPDPQEDVTLDLRPHHRERYEAIRRGA